MQVRLLPAALLLQVVVAPMRTSKPTRWWLSLLELTGCGALTAAKLVGETDGICASLRGPSSRHKQHCAGARLVRQHHARPSQSRWQSSVECCTPPHRRHPTAAHAAGRAYVERRMAGTYENRVLAVQADGAKSWPARHPLHRRAGTFLAMVTLAATLLRLSAWARLRES